MGFSLILVTATGVRLRESESQSQSLLRSSLPAADLTAEMETMAQRQLAKFEVKLLSHAHHLIHRQT